MKYTFDAVARLVERRMPEFAPTMNKSKLFIIDADNIHDAVDASLMNGDYEEMTQMEDALHELHLPFRNVAIEIIDGENEQSVLFLEDIDPDAFGMHAPRKFTIFMPTPSPSDSVLAESFGESFCDHLEQLRAENGMFVISGIHSDSMVIEHSQFLTEKQEFGDGKHTGFDIHAKSDIGTTFLAFARLNVEKRFVFEDAPAKPSKKKGSPKIPRVHQRSKFTFLTDKQIRKLTGWGKPGSYAEGTKKAPHPRRGYWRRYKSDRYVNVQGTQKWIDAIWIGPTEADVGNHRYKVRLDV